MTTAGTQIVPITQVVVDKGFNNRRQLGDLTELAASIKSVGLLEPLIVWRSNGSFHLIAGERRLAASKLAGQKQVEIKVVELDEKARLEALLVENLHRKDIDPVEEADGYRRLMDLGLKQKEIAAKVGRSEAHVSKRLSLIGLGAVATKLLTTGTIPIDAAIGLAKYDEKYQEKAIEHVKRMYSKIEDAAPYQLRNLGDRAKEEADKDASSKKKAELKRKLKAVGVTVIGAAQSYSWGQPGQPWRLGAPTKNSYREESRVDMTPKQHEDFACHAAAITGGDRYTPLKVVYLCTDPTSHMTAEAKAKYKAKLADGKRDSYAEQERRRKEIRAQIIEAQLNRTPAIRELLRSADQQSLATLALETFVSSSNLTELAELLGLPAGKEAKEKSVVDYCNASHANLVRAAAAVAVCMGERALLGLVDSHAGGYYFERADTHYAVSLAELLSGAGIQLSDVERKALEKAGKR